MYIELHCHSNFSLLDGAAHPAEMVARAAELRMPALALTDHDAVYGAVRFAQAAKAHGVRPIFGAELTLASGHHLTLLVENEIGWRNLCALISQARHHAPKGEAALPLACLPAHTAGLIALSGCRQGEVAQALLRQDVDGALSIARRYRDWFGPAHFWLELQHHLLPDDDRLGAGLVKIARRLGLGYVATNNVHYPTRAGRQLQDVLVCIKQLTSLDEAGPLLRPNSEFYLKPARQLQPLFAAYPEALTNTLLLADRCHFDLHYGLQDLPPFPPPAGLSATEYLRRLCQRQLTMNNEQLVMNNEQLEIQNSQFTIHNSSNQATAQLEHELSLIDRAGLSHYFLIVWDIVRFAREQGIRCQGRGSAANSLVAYLLGISPIDPLAHDLVFERFLSAERAGAPDIDLDFDAARREEVIQYVYRRYGPEHAAMACTFVTFRARSAVRDVAKVLGLSPELLPHALREFATGRRSDKERLTPLERTQPGQLLLDLCRQLEGYPRHLGLHSGGMVITGAPITERLPTEPATMPDRVVVQWDKEELVEAGLVKIDLLGLRMLSAIDEAVTLIGETTGRRPDLQRLTFADPAVYRLIAEGSTIGIFQVESRAQAQLQPRLKPTCFGDLVIAISLIRPGPIQGNMVHPYLRRRAGVEPVSYAHPLLKLALEETLGVILFQEQVLKVARDLAGFSPGQGEQLRRALGAKEGEARVELLRETFVTGAAAKGVPAEITHQVFDQLRAFGGYAFAKSHAAAFAVIVYQSAWLKRYYPAAFLCGLMRHQPMGFWSPAVLIGDAKRHGIKVLPVDLDWSEGKCTVEAGAIRLGFDYVSGFGEAAVTRLLEARQARPFRDLTDLCRRSRLPQRLIEHLIRAGACDRWQVPRRTLLWELGQLHYSIAELDLPYPATEVELPPLSEVEAQLWERQVQGLSAGPHVMARYRAELSQEGILGSEQLKGQPHGRRVRVAGLVVVHQSPPTAKGVHFLTLEDSEGLMDVVVKPDIYARYRPVIRTEPLLVIEGLVQRQERIVSLLAGRVTPLSSHAIPLDEMSDF